MDQPLYDVFFTGQLVEGTDLATAKSNFAKLFKSSPEHLEKLFSGKPQAIKRGVDKAEALKFKAALHKAGLLIAFKAHQIAKPDATPATTTSAAPEQPESSTAAPTTNSPQASNDDWSVAPTGSDVLAAHERKPVQAQNIDTSAIKMVSAFAEAEVETKPAPPAPDTSHISVAQVGEDLLLEKPEPPPALPLDLENLSLAPAGADLEELRPELPALNPDISDLSIAEAGADLLKEQQNPPPPPAPNTDHITIVKD